MRGLNSKIGFIKDFLINNNVTLVALLETHVKQENAERIFTTLSARLHWRFNYDFHVNGRIWIGFDPSLWKVVTVSQSVQHIFCIITRISLNESFAASFLYMG